MTPKQLQDFANGSKTFENIQDLWADEEVYREIQMQLYNAAASTLKSIWIKETTPLRIRTRLQSEGFVVHFESKSALRPNMYRVSFE